MAREMQKIHDLYFKREEEDQRQSEGIEIQSQNNQTKYTQQTEYVKQLQTELAQRDTEEIFQDFDNIKQLEPPEDIRDHFKFYKRD